MAPMAEMRVTVDPETLAAMKELSEQVRALRDLLETRSGIEVHCHFAGGPSPAGLAAEIARAVRAAGRLT